MSRFSLSQPVHSFEVSLSGPPLTLMFRNIVWRVTLQGSEDASRPSILPYSTPSLHVFACEWGMYIYALVCSLCFCLQILSSHLNLQPLQWRCTHPDNPRTHLVVARSLLNHTVKDFSKVTSSKVLLRTFGILPLECGHLWCSLLCLPHRIHVWSWAQCLAPKPSLIIASKY